jgi:hypothetical protein
VLQSAPKSCACRESGDDCSEVSPKFLLVAPSGSCSLSSGKLRHSDSDAKPVIEEASRLLGVAGVRWSLCTLCSGSSRGQVGTAV